MKTIGFITFGASGDDYDIVSSDNFEKFTESQDTPINKKKSFVSFKITGINTKDKTKKSFDLHIMNKRVANPKATKYFFEADDITPGHNEKGAPSYLAGGYNNGYLIFKRKK